MDLGPAARPRRCPRRLRLRRRRPAASEAIGVADAAIRRGRGRRVYALGIGDEYAARAYREGAPRRRSGLADFDALGRAALEVFGLGADATADDVRRAYRRGARKAHPDKGGSDAAFIDLQAQRDRALDFIAARDEEARRAGFASGELQPEPPKKRRPRRETGAGTVPMPEA